MTSDFVGRVSTLSQEVEQTRDEVLKWKKIRDKFQDLSDALLRDRSAGSNYKYEHTIEDMIERAQALEQ